MAPTHQRKFRGTWRMKEQITPQQIDQMKFYKTAAHCNVSSETWSLSNEHEGFERKILRMIY